MIGANELALMKPEAIIVNTSRGPVIDEMALTQTLSDNKIFGAGSRRVRPGAAAAGQSAVQARQRGADRRISPVPPGTTTSARFRNAFDNVQRVARGEKPLWVVPELAELAK